MDWTSTPNAWRWLRSNQPAARLTQGDALSLPYAAGCFDLVLCHFLLLWISDPVHAVAEMRRVTRPGGSVLALAEPDYGGRIDYPKDLEVLGDWQRFALQRQGADPQIGRRLGEIFNRAGIKLIEAGVLGGQWHAKPTRQEWALEWSVLLSDLQALSGTEIEEEKLKSCARWTGSPGTTANGSYSCRLFMPGDRLSHSKPTQASTGTPTSICPSTTRTG
jgi:SAM-dependent methyltransferase